MHTQERHPKVVLDSILPAVIVIWSKSFKLALQLFIGVEADYSVRVEIACYIWATPIQRHSLCYEAVHYLLGVIPVVSAVLWDDAVHVRLQHSPFVTYDRWRAMFPRWN